MDVCKYDHQDIRIYPAFNQDCFDDTRARLSLVKRAASHQTRRVMAARSVNRVMVRTVFASPCQVFGEEVPDAFYLGASGSLGLTPVTGLQAGHFMSQHHFRLQVGGHDFRFTGAVFRLPEVDNHPQRYHLSSASPITSPDSPTTICDLYFTVPLSGDRLLQRFESPPLPV